MSTLTGLISSGGGINSVQRGTVTGTSTVTISSVDVNKTFVNVSFKVLEVPRKQGLAGRVFMTRKLGLVLGRQEVGQC